MIELKNLTKIYKGGANVKALDGVSFVLPDKGLVFILGKSGCGKSTLLNLVGGLDKPTEGEIIIKGRSSRKFSASDFDSYRNTYVGFIFQEYNVMPEFSVAENISLAPELQGKRVDGERFEGIMEEVELSGLEKRKPTTLSGGQKQRVAIARALVKDPQIILADEPTGALDSYTGRAVLDLLKRLSQEKLVVVVSHDRDFANKYADRIIELSDGRVISDVTFEHKEAVNEKGLTVAGDCVYVTEGLNGGMLERLNELLIDRQMLTIRIAAEDEYIEGGGFEPTLEQPAPAQEETEEKLIRSKFPLKYAFRMGASGLKTKRFRLVMTIILSTVALTAFGFMLALMFFDAQYTMTNALEEGGQSELGVAVYEVETQTIPIVNIDYTRSNRMLMKEDDVARLEAATGLNYLKIHQFGDTYYGHYYGNTGYSFYGASESGEATHIYYPTAFCGFASATEDELGRFGGSLIAGRMPSSPHEILISDLICMSIRDRALKGKDNKYLMIGETDYPVGKTLTIGAAEFTICGVFSCPKPDEKFDELKNVLYTVLYSDDLGEGLWGNSELKRIYALRNELQSLYFSSLSTVCFVSEDFYDANKRFYTNDYKGLYSDGSDFWFSGSPAALDGETASYKLLEGKEFTDGTFLVTEESLRWIIEGCYEMDDSSRQLLYGRYYEAQKEPDGEQRLTEMLGILNDLRSVKYASALFDGGLVFRSEGKFESKAKKLTCVGVALSDGSNATMLLTKNDMKALFPGEGDHYDLAGADFVLTVNTPEARRILTDLKYGSTDTVRFNYYSCYQSDKIDEYQQIVAEVSPVLFWVGVVIAVFASLLLFNFISVSIN